jgi:hypothetical protein
MKAVHLMKTKNARLPKNVVMALNAVAKNLKVANKSVVMKDRKKAAKSGAVKHKNKRFDNYKIAA